MTSRSFVDQQEQPDVIIVGGGLAGLACGVVLGEAGKKVVLLEATDRVGGRVRSDVVDGYILDHGFQVLLTAYPACKRLLDYDALCLRFLEPGALIRNQGRFTLLGDPWRRPGQAISTALNPVGTLGDKLRVAKLRRQSRAGTLDDLYRRPQACATEDYLRRAGFSAKIIDQFFRPFIGGVFLDPSLCVSSRMLEFVFRMFSEGDVAIPAGGMAAIPQHLAQRLPHGTIRFESSVAKIDGREVHLTDETSLTARNVVVATESSTAARLLGIESLDTEWNSTTTIYYAAEDIPDRRKLLMLCGDETGPIETATILSNVAAEYAPQDRALISVNLGSIEDCEDLDRLDAAVRHQLQGWFGDQVKRWQRLRVYRVPFGVPRRSLDTVVRSTLARDHVGEDVSATADSVFVCGDYLETPSIQGAMNSGIRAAESILGKPHEDPA